jgi:hypothetical protein
MREPTPDEAAPAGQPADPPTHPPAEPTLRVARPPLPGRAVRADLAAGHLATPPVHHDEPTVTLDSAPPVTPQRTLEFGTPEPVRVTVGPRARPRRRYRTWPWVLAVVVALLVLGAVLVVMVLNGATVDPDVDLVGSGQPAPQIDSPAPSPGR